MYSGKNPKERFLAQFWVLSLTIVTQLVASEPIPGAETVQEETDDNVLEETVKQAEVIVKKGGQLIFKIPVKSAQDV